LKDVARCCDPSSTQARGEAPCCHWALLGEACCRNFGRRLGRDNDGAAEWRAERARAAAGMLVMGEKQQRSLTTTQGEERCGCGESTARGLLCISSSTQRASTAHCAAAERRCRQRARGRERSTGAPCAAEMKGAASGNPTTWRTGSSIWLPWQQRPPRPAVQTGGAEHLGQGSGHGQLRAHCNPWTGSQPRCVEEEQGGRGWRKGVSCLWPWGEKKGVVEGASTVERSAAGLLTMDSRGRQMQWRKGAQNCWPELGLGLEVRAQGILDAMDSRLCGRAGGGA
jgi:hypothetical protein